MLRSIRRSTMGLSTVVLRIRADDHEGLVFGNLTEDAALVVVAAVVTHPNTKSMAVAGWERTSSVEVSYMLPEFLQAKVCRAVR